MKKYPVDLLFLDINMPSIPEIDFFTTAYFELPVFSWFQQAVEKAFSQWKLQNQNSRFRKQFSTVFNGSNYWSTTAGFWSNGIKDVFQIELDNGCKIKLTDNHKLLIKNRKKKKGVIFLAPQLGALTPLSMITL